MGLVGCHVGPLELTAGLWAVESPPKNSREMREIKKRRESIACESVLSYRSYFCHVLLLLQAP